MRLSYFRLKKKELLEVVFGMILVIALSYASEEFIPGRLAVQKIIISFVAVLGMLIWLNSGACVRKHYTVALWFTIPCFITAVYTVLLRLVSNGCFLDDVSIQAVTTSIYMILDCYFVLALIYIFKRDAIYVFSIVLIFSYLYVLLNNMIFQGVSVTIEKLFNKSIERNDIGVAVVPLILYYFFSWFVIKHKIETKEFWLCLMLFGIMVFCGKRSAYLSIIIGMLLIFLFARIKQKRIVYIVSACVFCGSFLFIILIKSGIIASLLQNKGTLTDRYYVWKHFDSIYSVNPLYFGWGFTFVHRYMENGLGDWMVNAYGYLHNTILQLYIETGFWCFVMWMTFYLFAVPVKMNRYGQKAVMFSVISIVAMLAMYMFDNTLTYPLYQISLILALSYFSYTTKEKKSGNN